MKLNPQQQLHHPTRQRYIGVLFLPFLLYCILQLTYLSRQQSLVGIDVLNANNSSLTTDLGITASPQEIQTKLSSLALLWRTLNIIKNIDGLSVVDFYEKFLPTLKAMPNLSLSTYWEEVSDYLSTQNVDQSKFKSIVGVPTIPVVSPDGGTTETKKSVNSLMNIPELEYLKHDERIDYKHDPLQVVHNLYGAAAAYTVDASPYNQSILMSACLAVAVKSGRASLLLHVASMIATVISSCCDPEAPYISIDLDPLKDILDLLTHEVRPAVALPIVNNDQPTDSEQENEVVRYRRDPLLAQSTSEGQVRADGVGCNRKGMVLSFGKADHGKLGHGDVQLHRLVPTLIESLQDVEIRKTASMSTYSVAIDTEGAVYVWGTGGPAGAIQSSKTDIQPQLLEALPLHAKVVDVSCGLGHALFLLHTGRVFSWGNGGNGRLGLGDVQDRSEACPVVLLQHERITAVQCGASHSMALTSAGRVYSWGKNTQGQCGHGNIDDHIKPTSIRKLEDHLIIQLAAGWEHSLALTQEGTLYSWGSGYKDNRRGVVPPVLGLGHNEVRQSPELIASIESVRIINIACGWDHCLAVDEHGKVLSWGSGQNGKLGLGTEENVSLPCYIPTLDCDDEINNPTDAKKDGKGTNTEPKKRLFVTHLSAGCEHTAVLTRDGEVYAWGHGDGGRLGHGNNAQCMVPTKVESFALMGVKPTSVHCGDKFTMILANAPDSASSVRPRWQLLNASTGCTSGQSNAYFLETKTFLRENVINAGPEQMKHKLNFQTLESTQILKSLLVLMASASLPRVDVSADNKETNVSVSEMMSLVTRFAAHSAQKGTDNNETTASDDIIVRNFDREYAVECADSTYTNLLQILDVLLIPFQLSLSSFVGHSDSSNIISAQISSLSLQSASENVFSSSVGQLLHGNNNGDENNQNSNNESFRTTSVTNPESPRIEAQKIVDQFESIYALLIIITANLEVLTERCQGLKKSVKEKSGDSFHVRAKDWRNIQREVSRLMPISFDEKLNTGRSAQSERSEQSHRHRRHSTGTGQDDPDEEDPDDFQADADAECSLGSMESEEHLLHSMVRQHQQRREFAQGTEGESRHAEAQHHRHQQQDQQSDDDDQRDYHDENSAYEGEERDFGADSGDDSFFSGDRSRMRAGTDYDTSFNADEDHLVHLGDMSPLSGAQSHPAPAAMSSARGRHPIERVGDSSVESSRAGDWERDRDADHAAYGSRSGSPAQSLDSLTHPRNSDRFDRVESREQEEGYLTENSYSDSQDSRFDRRGSGKQRGGAAGHHREEEEEDDDMERYYEEQALGMENLDLQRAIISSMQENTSDAPYETVAYRGTAQMYDCTPGRFGEGIGLSTADSQPAIPRIRDVLNALASRCFQAIDVLSRQGAVKTGKSYKSEVSSSAVNSPVGDRNPSDPMEGTAVQSVYLLWEAVQTATNTGYEMLYTQQDQKAVLCQLVRSPAQFLYILPGVVNGASCHNTLYALLDALFPSNEALFTANESRSETKFPEDSLDISSVLSFLSYVNLYIRAGNDIISKVPKSITGHTSPVILGANTVSSIPSINSAELFAAKMHSGISSGLITLTKYLLRVLLDRVEASGAFLNDTIGLRPEQPWGADVSKILEIVTDCVASDIEILTSKVEIFDDSTEARFVDSFTASVMGFLYSRVMAHPGVVQAVALLPTSMRLLRLFQGSYDSYKRQTESKERFNSWLMGSFQWVVYHITGVVNIILHPSPALTPPPLRPAAQACKELLSAADLRKHFLDASSGNNPYSWEQMVWSVLHRADPAISRNNSTLSSSDTAAAALDGLRNADARASLMTGADVDLLILNSIVSECIAMNGLCQTIFSPEIKESGLNDLSRFFATSSENYWDKRKRGEQCLWTIFSNTAQLYVSILHTLCASSGLNLSNLVALVEPKSDEPGASKLNVLSLLNSSADLTTFVSLMFSSLAIVAASLESTAEAHHIVNKAKILKDAVARSKQLAASGFVVAGVTGSSLIVPIVVVKEAAAGSVKSAPALSDHWQALMQAHILPAKQSIKAALLASEFWIDAAVHSQLSLKANPVQTTRIEPARTQSGFHDLHSKLAVFLLTKNLSLNFITQQAMWEEDSLKNQQYALSLLLFLSDCLQNCPEVMHYCAESLHSFGDPQETLENLQYVLSNSVSSAEMSNQRKSSNHKVEQLLSKLDAQLVAKITSSPSHTVVPTRKEEVKRMQAGFGQPTLKQIPDLLTFLRHGMITNAQFGLDAQGMVDYKANAVAPVSFNPISTALKKTADVITALLASRQPEDHGALSLQDVLNANKYINLLQSTLGGLAAMQGIDAQHKAQSVVPNTRSSGIPGADKTHDKSAFLHALCGVLNPLGNLMKVLINCFQQHLLFCQAVGVQFLFPSIKAIEHSSPTLLSNVFAPQGNYSLGFWLYLPPIDVLLPETTTTNNVKATPLRIHLLSRVYEIGEMNVLSLLGTDITEAISSFSLSVHVVIEDTPTETASSATPKTIYLEVTAAATDFASSTRETLNASANARSRALKKVSIRSKPLESLEWISCVVELVQDSVPQSVEATAAINSAVGGAAKAQARRQHKTKYTDTTTVALFVNNTLQSATSLSAGRSSLYQSMIIGKIPSKLGVIAGEKKQIFLTDVFWVPTSVYLSSAGSEYAKMRAFLTKLGSQDLIYTPAADNSANSTDRNDYYRNLLPASPPSLLLETIDNAFHCASQLLELLKAHLKTPSGSTTSVGGGAVVNCSAMITNRPTETYTGSTLPLNLIPIVSTFAVDVICIADARAQESAFQTLAALLESFPPTVTPSEGGAAVDLSKSPAGSAFNAAVQNKATLAVKQAIVFSVSLLNDFFHTHHSSRSDALELGFLTESPYALKPSSSRDIWQKRLQLGRISIERSLRITEWGTRIILDENLIASGVASLLALAVRNGLGDAKFQQDCGLFAMLVAGGGWAPTVSVGRVAQLLPRKLFLHFDARAYEQCAFPATAHVAGAAPNRPGVWLGQCLGAYQRIDAVPGLMPLVPRTLRAAILSTEMIPTRDPFAVLTMPQLQTVMKNYTLKSADELIAILKTMVAPSAADNEKSGPKKPNHARALITQFESVAANDPNCVVFNDAEEAKTSDEAQQQMLRQKDHNYLDLMQEMAFLRLLSVQVTHAAQANQITRSYSEDASVHSQLDTLRNSVLKNLDKLLSIAVQDPVQAVSVIFSSGTFKGVQLDVLKNLLKEGDISFLERISLRLWKQYKLDINPSCESGYGTAAVNTSQLQIASLAGEVVISETKIRAQTHFPTVRLLGVSISRMTGRWFYECTLLSDGLIQMGWANAMFRCDPICGQGVGDHNHSWAFDGLRCKKWNVSCEPYGRRWKFGDTVGTLIDMDLLEIRFYLNGEDLGQAFEDFSSHDVFPALSLNLRQCVRLNFGQYKFLHPPDELDGKPFRPVIAALQMQKPVASLIKPTPASPTKKATASPGMAVSGLKSPVADSAERGATAVSHLTPVMERLQAGTASTESLLGAQVAAVMTPLRQALTSNMNTPAGAETPSTNVLTPAQTPSLAASESASMLQPIAEVAVSVAPSVTFSTPPRQAQSIEVSAALVLAENQSEEQENETAAQMQMEAWDAAQQRHQAAARARAQAVHDPYLTQRTSGQYGEAEEEEDQEAEEHDEAEGLERELQRELEEHERELLAEREYEREEDREEEEDEDDDDEDDEEMDAEDELRERNRDNDDLDEADEVNAHLVEMRRQAMIENLVNMGLPEEWAIRAAQQTDISHSETAAITWIIERMELEQNGHAGGMSQEEEDFDESEQDLDYFMNRNPAAFRLQRSESENSGTSGPAGGNMALSTHSQRLLAMQRGVNPIDGNNSSLSGGMSGLASGSGVSPGGSPTREEIYGLRRNLANVLAEDDAVSRGTTKSTSMGKVNVRGMSTWGNGGGADSKLFDDMAGATAWNADLSVPPVLIGQYVARRRHDQDKQEVLAQVIELDQADMLPIIIACEFSLCIYYARAVLLRSAAFVDNKFLAKDVDLDCIAKNIVESKSVADNADPHSDSLRNEQRLSIISRTPSNGALHQLGMPLLASLFMQSASEPLVIVELFKICFKQHVVGLTQPDRLFPLIANGNVLGEARDRVPLISPFVSGNVSKLHAALSRLELQLFPGFEGTLAVDESSIQGLDILSRMLDVAIYYANEVSLLPAQANASSPLSITSNLRELQSQLLRNLGVSVDAEDVSWVEKFAAGCKVTLYTLVHEALECLQAATSAKYDSFDWILLCLDRHEKPAEPSATPSSFKADAASLLSQQQENAPAVAYAYWLLRSVLTKSEIYNLHKKNNAEASDGSATNPGAESAPEAKSTASDFSPGRAKASPGGRSASTTAPSMSAIDYLTSADTLAKLLKISATQNVSLRFCAYDLSALILSRVNVTLSASMAQRANEAAVAGAPSPQIAASEYYITIAKEKRMLQMFGARMKAEVHDRRMITRYTRSVGAFLFQWHLLRRQLGLSSVNYMHEYLMADLSLHTESAAEISTKPSAFSRSVTSDLAEALTMSPQTLQRSQRKEASPEKAETTWYGVRITQLTSNSVTVDWSLDPIKFPPRIKMPDFASHAYVPPAVTTHEANLYFTPASHMGLEAPVLVLSSLEQNGTFHIDDLDADTLYKITISKDNAMNTSSDQEDEGEDSELAAHQEITLAMQARSVALLSYFDNGAPISSPQKDSAVTISAHSPASSAAPTPTIGASNRLTNTTAPLAETALTAYSPASTTPGKSLAPFPAMLDLQPHSARGASMDRTLARLKSSSGSANPIVKPGGELVRCEEGESSTKDEVMMFISTESEAPFQFDLEQMSPNLLVSPHSLTLLNQSNKKWSTARANVRLNSGVHRWDVHIDRCISKNIFIGVAAREAHLNNYVGCDKHGWAFLANKAVWHNKGKTKTYGDLFRSGDTVTVILDLDEGTLSYNLNNKPLGVAVEGLVGPLYPAFSLYNEGDQLTVVKVRSAAGESGGAGSCAAEKILERIETFNNLLNCVAETFKVEAASALAIPSSEPSGNNVPVSLPPSMVTITEELGEELLQRWELWKAEIPMRSFLVGNDFVTICASAPQCLVLSRGLLQLWESVVVQKELAMVLGVGQHRLWFRTQATGALCGYTADSIQHMHDKGTLHRVDPGSASRETALHCSANQITAFEKCSYAGAGLQTDMFGFEMSAVAMKEAVCKLQTVWKAEDDIVLVDYLNACARKYASDPFNLNICHILGVSSNTQSGAGESEILHPLCAKYTPEVVALRALMLIHFNDLALPLLPILCPFSSASEDGPFFADAHVLSTLSNEAASNHPTSMIKTMRTLFFSQVKREFSLRLTGNSTCGGAVSIVRPPLSTCSLTRETASSEKQGGRVLQSILHTLKEDATKLVNSAADSSPNDRTRQSLHELPFLTADEESLPLLLPFQPPTSSTALTHPNRVVAVTPTGRSFYKFPVGDSPALTASTASLVLPVGFCGIVTSTLDYLDVEQMLILEVSEEAALAKQLYDDAVSKEVHLQLLLDERWKLLSGFQCSYVGQMMSYFEQIAGLNPNSTATLPETAANTPKGSRHSRGSLQNQLAQLQLGGNAAAWESCLKISSEGMGMLWYSDTRLAAQRTVPFVVRATKHTASSGNTDNTPPTKLFQWLQIVEHNPEKISEWTLFAVFVDEACSQVRRVMESLYDTHSGRLMENALLCTDAAMLNLSLQLFHAAGVLVGLALRTGVPIYLPMPASFYAILSNTVPATAAPTVENNGADSQSQLAEDATFVLATAVRTGIIATFPEPALDLLSCDELRGVFRGELGYGPPSTLLLHRHATYEAPLCAEDPHIMLFWAAMYELPTKNVQVLLEQLMPATISPARVHQVLYGSQHLLAAQEPFHLHILPPTAVAMLSPDVSEIVLFADRGALALPKYSNLKVMMEYLQRLSAV